MQQIVDNFKNWIGLTNRIYEQTIRRGKEEEESKQRKQLQDDMAAMEKKRRVLANIKI